MNLITKSEGLSSEFLRIGGGDSDWERIESGLRQVNIVKSGEEMTSFEDGEPWHRGGAETFVADSRIGIVGLESRVRHVIGKALVSFATDLEVKLKIWLRRRSLLADIGIPVPFLYCGRTATVFEEFIDEPLNKCNLADPSILEQIGRIGAGLDLHGFRTLSFLSDLRVKEGRLYYVDFGIDLGEPSEVLGDSARIALIASLPASQIAFCLRVYDWSVKELTQKRLIEVRERVP